MLMCAATPAAGLPFVWFEGVHFGQEGNEGIRAYDFKVRRAELPTTLTVTISVVTKNATPGTDFVAISEQLTFLPGETTKAVQLRIYGDRIDEFDELLDLVAKWNGTEIGRSSFLIVDDEEVETLILSTAARAAEDSGSIVFRFRLTAWPTAMREMRFDYATVDGTAVAWNDYRPVSGTIIIPYGTSPPSIVVPLMGDKNIESDETFTLRLSNAVSVDPLDREIRATIVNDDFFPSFSVVTSEIPEGNSGSRQVPIRIALLSTMSTPVTATIQSRDIGTAIAGVDYLPFTETLTFPAGVTELSVNVTVLGDTIDEKAESFEVRVVQDGAIRVQKNVRIEDDDSEPVISISDVELKEGDHLPKRAFFSVTLSNPAVGSVRVFYETVGETATPFGDFTPLSGEIVIPPGETSRILAVDVLGDLEREPTETFRIRLSNATRAKIGESGGVCTIVDNDPGRRRAARH